MTAAGRRNAKTVKAARGPTAAQTAWLRRGLDQPGGKLPLFDGNGQRVSRATIRACLNAGWVEPWCHNPLKPEWDICRLSDAGRRILAEMNVVRIDFAAGNPGRRSGGAPPDGPPRGSLSLVIKAEWRTASQASVSGKAGGQDYRNRGGSGGPSTPRSSRPATEPATAPGEAAGTAGPVPSTGGQVIRVAFFGRRR